MGEGGAGPPSWALANGQLFLCLLGLALATLLCPSASPLPRGPGAQRRVYVCWEWEEGVTDQQGPEVKDCCLPGIPTVLHEKRAISASTRPHPFPLLRRHSPFALRLITCLYCTSLSYLHVHVMRWRQVMTPLWDLRESNERVILKCTLCYIRMCDSMRVRFFTLLVSLLHPDNLANS